MKPTTKNTNSINQQINERLTQRGFYAFVDWARRLDSIGDKAYYALILVVISRLLVSLYYYPRSIQYLLANPLTEAFYLLDSIAVFSFIALGVWVAFFLITVITSKLLADKALHIYNHVYNEFGIEAPEFEI